MDATETIRIGELSRRTGVSPELLRAWERRYGLLRPGRSSGGLRLYSREDEERVRRMQEALRSGLAAAEAAAIAIASPAVPRPVTPQPGIDLGARRTELAAALDRFDGAAAHAAIDRVLAEVTLDAALRDVLLPYLRDLGDRWERGAITVAQEHFASALLRGRLLGLARDWGRGEGPTALLACLPGEGHELGLIAFGLALRSRGWRIAYLGVDTPVGTLAEAADDLRCDLVAVCALTPEPVDAAAPELAKLASRFRVVLGGAAAAAADLPDAVERLQGDVVNEAERLTAALPARGAERARQDSNL